jgi:hypothetical protein
VSHRFLYIVGALVLVGAAAGAFYAGTAYERARQAEARADFFAARGSLPEGEQITPFGGPGGSAGGPGPLPRVGQGLPAFEGTVKGVEGSTVTISTPLDVITVVLDEETSVRQEVGVDAGALQEGQQVSVFGQEGEDGVVTADSIVILAGSASP